MRGLLAKLLRREVDGSKEDAKARLKFLLVHDQIDLTPAQMEAMKTELMEVISRYVEIENSGVDFRLEREEGAVALVSNIPVRRVTARAF